MKKIFISILLVTVLFLGGCDGKDGETGVAGVTGTGGCDFDEMFDKDTGICIPNPNYLDPTKGDQGEKGDDADLTSVQEYVEDNCKRNADDSLTCAAP